MCKSVFARETPTKTENVNKKQSLLFSFCNIFDLLTSRTQKIAWWAPVFKPDFYIFPYNEQLRKIERKFIDKFLLYHTSLTMSLQHQQITHPHFTSDNKMIVDIDIIYQNTSKTQNNDSNSKEQ